LIFYLFQKQAADGKVWSKRVSPVPGIIRTLYKRNEEYRVVMRNIVKLIPDANFDVVFDVIKVWKSENFCFQYKLST
jgi:hypothetical protein